MLFFRVRRSLIRHVKREYNYYKTLSKAKQIVDTNKILFLDVSDIALNRYLYGFLKFFQINGYTVYLPKNKNIISVLSQKNGEFRYASWLLEEGFVKFGRLDRDETDLWLDARQLSNDYFSKFFGSSNLEKSYHIPICEYPHLYHTNSWEMKIKFNTSRKRSVFMIGNCNRGLYSKFSESGIFEMPNRAETAEFLYEKEYYKELNSLEELNEFSDNNEDSKLILIDTSNKFQIEGHELKETFASFYYYLALPGIEVPYSHNLAEAMSVGCIPIIHKNYASLMDPKLVGGVNCFVYQDLIDLDFLINRLFTLKDPDLKRMQGEILSYYNEHLSPNGVVGKIEKNNFEKIYIQAEVISLRYLNRNAEN